MEFTLKLNSLPFEMIESGIKTIELRLYDEKRRKISIGDMIRFILVDDESKELHVKVKELYIFPSFEELYPARKSIRTNFAHVGGPDGLQFQADAVAYCG